MHHDIFLNRSSKSIRPLAFFAAATVFAASASAAVTWHDVQFGGFVSQCYLVNTGNNDYLGNTSDGTFDFRAAGRMGSGR